MTFTVTTGTRYRAMIRLGLFEQVASNDAIASKLLDAGFVNVTVTGSGRTRFADGEWGGAPQTAELPDQITTVTVLP